MPPFHRTCREHSRSRSRRVQAAVKSASRTGGAFPKPEAAGERVSVGATAGTRRKILELLDVAAAQDDILGLQGEFKKLRDLEDLAPPPLLAEPLETAPAEVVLVGLSLLIREMRQFQGLKDAVRDQRGAQ